MIEVDGPNGEFFPYRGLQHVYTHHVVAGADPGLVLETYASWRQAVDDPESILVWRQRPRWQGDPRNNWTLTWRCAVVKAS